MYRTLTIKNITLRNRIAIPPMVCFHWTDAQGYVTEKNIEHYRELALGGAGLVIVEATAIDPAAKLHETELGLWEDGQIEGFCRITEAIHAGGAKAFIQLVHAGNHGVDSLTEEELATAIRHFADSALRAKKAGFDGVELHGCHGYLISQLLNRHNNHRIDAYGTDRTLFAKKALTAVRETVGPDFIVGIRLGASEPEFEDGLTHANALAALTDFFDVSYGNNWSVSAPEGFPCSPAVYGASLIKKAHPEIPVFGVDHINSREDVIAALSTGIDLVDVGKASLVDPAFAHHEYSKLFNLCYPEFSMSPGQFRRLLMHENTVRFEVFRAGRLAGFALLEATAIRLLLVHPDYRNQGIGSKLLSDIEEYLRDHGAEKVLTGGSSSRFLIGADSRTWNFFSKKGFDAVGQCEEMTLPLRDYTYDMARFHGHTLAKYGWYDGPIETLHEAVSAVDPDWVQYFTDPKSVYVGTVDGKIASFCIVDTDSDNYLSEALGRVGMPGCVGTVPEYRNKGIALEMIALVTQYLKEQSMDVSFIFYTGVARWYEKLGYKTFLTEMFGVKKL